MLHCESFCLTNQASSDSCHDSNYSFAKYLELMFYSTSFACIQPTICEHTAQNDKSPPSTDPPTTHSRTQVRRHFRHNYLFLTLQISTIESDLFEVRVPRVQIVKSIAEIKKQEGLQTEGDQVKMPDQLKFSGTSRSPEVALEEQGSHRERDDLRLEITYWWSGLKEHLTKLVSREITLLRTPDSITYSTGGNFGWRDTKSKIQTSTYDARRWRREQTGTSTTRSV